MGVQNDNEVSKWNEKFKSVDSSHIVLFRQLLSLFP